MAYLAEYLPRIGIVQISFTDNYELDHITEKQVLMKNGETFNLPHQVILDPGNDATSKNVKSLVNEKVISIRCKAVGGARLKSSANHSTLCFYEKWNSIELKKLHGFFLVCNNCQEKVLDSTYYDKIYDLPSENWTELMDLWHCHKPDENVNFFYQSSMNKLIPANKELFIGESYFLINNSNACLIKGKLIECKKCFSELGMLSANGYKFNKWNLCLINNSTGELSYFRPYEFVVQNIMQHVKSMGVRRFKLITRDGKSIFLWCFDIGTTVLINNEILMENCIKILYKDEDSSEKHAEEEITVPKECFDDFMSYLILVNSKLPDPSFLGWRLSYINYIS